MIFSVKSEDEKSWGGVSLVPRPVQPSVTCSTKKWERVWYLFSHGCRQERKSGRNGLIVCECRGAKI